jgi:hypothetical protein
MEINAGKDDSNVELLNVEPAKDEVFLGHCHNHAT